MDSDENRTSATFNLVVKNFVSLKYQGVYSLPCMIRNIPWKLHAYKDSRGSPSLALQLYCMVNTESNCILHPFWNCSAKFKIIILNSHGQDHFHEYDHVFHSGSNNHGSVAHISWNTVTNPQKGYLFDDTVRIRAEVAVSVPLGIEFPPKDNSSSELLESKKQIQSLESEVARLKTDLAVAKCSVSHLEKDSANEKSELRQLKIDFATEKADTSSKIKILETLVTNLVLQISELKRAKESASLNGNITSSAEARDVLLSLLNPK